MIEETESQDEVVEEIQSRPPQRVKHARGPKRRHDVQPEGVAKPRKQRAAARRHDTPAETVMPLDGYGDPLHVKCQKGWRVAFVSEDDRLRMGARRRWELATWGDPRIISYEGVVPGDKGDAIKFKELTGFLISDANHAVGQATDHRRIQHNLLRVKLFRAAETSGAYDAYSGSAIPGAHQGFVNVHQTQR